MKRPKLTTQLHTDGTQYITITRGRYRLPDSNSTLSTLSTPSQGDDQDEPLFGEYENQQEGA